MSTAESAQEAGVSTMRAVTISREYGSGGGEIALRLAERLGWRLVDHEVVKQIAQRLGVEEEDAAAHDEHAESWVMQFLTTMQGVGPMVALPSNLSFPPTEASYTRALRDVVNGAVLAGQSVIVGRGSQIILRNRRDTLHVRIVAPLEQRITYVALRESLTRAAAQQRILQRDQERRRYLLNTYRHAPEDVRLYDIILNTAVLDLDSCVELIVRALEAKATQLTTPPGELGPAGERPAPYPAAPIDFRVTPGPAPASVPVESAPPDGAAPNESGA
ncbi:MAG TPA: cytidylate kinase family protein [Ktedonobacterales bacterium]|nr:cytidylate kinase family protein [Ktedonobacterales bacterium]HEX5572457.1 cytidylate kinase family protein [Ktedonobacterales bacterium]